MDPLGHSVGNLLACQGRGKASPPAATSPYPLTPSTPYPTPMHTHTLPAAIVLPAQAGEPRRLPRPTAAAAQRRTLRVQSLPRRRPGARPAKVRVQGLPCLVSLCPFRAIFRRDPRPPFGSRLGRYDLFPFVDFSDAPQRGRPTTIRPVPGRYDLSPFVDLSVAPQSQAAPRRPRQDQPEKTHSTIQSKSIPRRGVE